jgi:hypothetical protein
MKSWLLKNAFWILSAVPALLSFKALDQGNLMAFAAFFILMVGLLCFGVYYANVEFTKELLTEYDNLVRVQRNRRGLKVIKGGKNDAKSNPDSKSPGN